MSGGERRTARPHDVNNTHRANSQAREPLRQAVLRSVDGPTTFSPLQPVTGAHDRQPDAISLSMEKNASDFQQEPEAASNINGRATLVKCPTSSGAFPKDSTVHEHVMRV
ncbi:hypothetical protein D3C80_1851600 [compost metagenome]